MRKVLKKFFTEKDNETYDISKVLVSATVFSGIGLSVYSVVFNHVSFNMVDFGTGLGLLFGGTAALLKFKKESGE